MSMNAVQKLFMLAFCVSIIGAPTYAGAATDTYVEDLFCENTKNQEMYDENQFESYKMLIPGTDGWIYRSESDLRQNFSLDTRTLRNLEQLNEALNMHGTQLVMLLTPTRGMMHPSHLKEEALREFHYDKDAAWKSYYSTADSIRKLGIQVVTLNPVAENESFFYKRDHHWNPDGAKKAANAVADYLKKQPGYKDIAKTEYVTKSGEDYDFEGVSKKVFRKLCKTDQPTERIKIQRTEKVDAAAGADALFGEAAAPDIVLTGTSNSTQIPSHANFEGFLKEALSVDVVNMSISGGGLDTAMLDYLGSPFYRDHPAKYLIWEVPSYYDISNHSIFFREAIPLAYGQCQGKGLIDQSTVQLSEGSELLLSRLESKKITGSDYYIHLSFKKPALKPFKMDLRYKGNRDRFRFDAKPGDAGVGPYLMVLDDDKKQYLEKIVLWSPDENLGNTVTVSICKASVVEKEARHRKNSSLATEPKSQSSVHPSVFDRMKGLFGRNNAE